MTRLLGSMGGCVSVAFTENTKCPSREQAGQSHKTRFAEETFEMVDFACASNQPTSAHLTIEAIITVCSTEVVTASQFDAGVTGDAPVAAVYPERFVGVTVSRECCALASGCRNMSC